MAGVSLATVSHVINRTRYVRPELVDKIEKIIVETGYQNKIADKERKLLVGRESTIVALIPNIDSTIYRDMVAYMKQLVGAQGYQFLVAITDNDLKEEAQVLSGLLVNKSVAGIIHAPVSDVASNYTKLIQSGMPFVCVERNILGSGIDSVLDRCYCAKRIVGHFGMVFKRRIGAGGCEAAGSYSPDGWVDVHDSSGLPGTCAIVCV